MSRLVWSRVVWVLVAAAALVAGLLVSAGWARAEGGSPGAAGQVLGWGTDYVGELGDGRAPSFTTTPVSALLPAGVTVTAVASSNSFGNFYSLGLTSTGQVLAWGDNAFGDLGDGTTIERDTPVPVLLPAGVTVTAIAAGGGQSLALTSTGQVLAWGMDISGQLGDGKDVTFSTTPVPALVPAGVTVTAIAAGAGQSLAVTSTGQVLAWGENSHGELGDGTTTERDTPVPVLLPLGVTVTAIAAGGGQSLAVTSTGQVLAWGDNSFGELGDGTTTERDTPVPVLLPPGVRVTAVSGGGNFSLALTSSGRVLAWGENNDGQLGDGTTTRRETPVWVSKPAGVTITWISAGDANGLAVAIAGPTVDPEFTSIASAGFTAGAADSFTVTTTVDDAHGTAALTCAGCDLPTGVTFVDNGNGTATIAGTPGTGAGGVYSFTITATNSHGDSTQAFTLTVDQAPTLTGPSAVSFTAGTAGSSTYQATGYPDAPTIGLSAGVLPAGVGLAAPVSSTDANGDKVTTVTLSGTPAAGSGGVYPVTLVAGNGMLPDATINVTITVYEAPHVTSADHTQFIATHANSFPVTAAGGYPTGPLTYSESGALPPGVSLSSGGLLSGVPPVSASGYWPFTITVANPHGDSASQDFTLFVRAPAVAASTMVNPGDLPFRSVSADHECLTWSLSGYAAYAPVTVIAYTSGSRPYDLGTFDSNPHGKVTVNLCLPDSARGTYTLLAAGYQHDGTIRYQQATTIVQP